MFVGIADWGEKFRTAKLEGLFYFECSISQTWLYQMRNNTGACDTDGHTGGKVKNSNRATSLGRNAKELGREENIDTCNFDRSPDSVSWQLAVNTINGAMSTVPWLIDELTNRFRWSCELNAAICSAWIVGRVTRGDDVSFSDVY